MRTSWVRSRGLIQIDNRLLSIGLVPKLPIRTHKKPIVLVGVEAGERLGKRLAEAVATVRPRQHPMFNHLRTRVKR
jgi:hypothetical protein